MTGAAVAAGSGGPGEQDDTPGPRVRLVGHSVFTPPASVPGFDGAWTTDATDGDALAEFAGRACYRSWSRPIPETADNAGYLDHILQVGHLAVLEHSTATFYLTGVPLSVAAEVTRHRHFSVSQLSPRHQAAAGPQVVEPAAVAADPRLHERFQQAVDDAAAAYSALLEILDPAGAGGRPGVRNPLSGKQAREAARSVLPLATATDLVVTGNYRSWRHFIGMRATDPADVAIRTLAVTILRELQQLAPHSFADFRISTLPDGTALAASPLVRDA